MDDYIFTQTGVSLSRIELQCIQNRDGRLWVGSRHNVTCNLQDLPASPQKAQRKMRRFLLLCNSLNDHASHRH